VDERTLEIEKVAKEWAKREYFRQSMAGTVENDMTEEEFSQTVWDRAMFEGEIKFRIMKGEYIDEETELANFKAQQERRQSTMLKRAKAELAEILDEDNFGDDDKLKLPEEDDDKKT
jgi:Mn-containing catalase